MVLLFLTTGELEPMQCLVSYWSRWFIMLSAAACIVQCLQASNAMQVRLWDPICSGNGRHAMMD